MARKKKHAEHVNHERWLISYADFITLLFAFFVVMFAVSKVDSQKVGRFTESFSKAVGIEMFPEVGAGLMPGGEVPKPGPTSKGQPSTLPAELNELKNQLNALARRQASGGVQVIEQRNELVIRLSENLIFAPGDDTLKEPAIRALRAVATELAPRNVTVRIEGHTDDRPINKGRFRSNWDLSTSRATVVVVLLASAKIPSHRLSAAGYGEFHPVATNATEEGRAKNRRVDIVVSVMASAQASEAAADLDAKLNGGEHKEEPGSEKHDGKSDGEGTKPEKSDGKADPKTDAHSDHKGEGRSDHKGEGKTAEGEHDKHAPAKTPAHEKTEETGHPEKSEKSDTAPPTPEKIGLSHERKTPHKPAHDTVSPEHNL